MARIKHGTLVASTVATITLDEPYEHINVLNRDGTAEIFFTVEGTAPTVGGDDCQIVPAAIGSTSVEGQVTESATVVKLISSGTPKYTVTGS